MPGRNYTLDGNPAYRYGFNGKENDNEVKGTGNQQDYGMRIYDPRIAKFLSVDPITAQYPMLTPYQFASNRPIGAVDLDGLEAKDLMTGQTIIFPSMPKLKQLKSSDYLLWKDMLLFEKSDKYLKVLYTEQNRTEAVTRQEMDWAFGDRLNTDYYAVNITKLPAGMSEATLMNHIRKNFGQYLNNQRFSPNKDGASNNRSAGIWNSENPTGSIIVFRDWRDNAAVLTTQSSKNHWVFTPVGTSGHWEHPLAGHREFGLTKNENGSYTFYTRGVDMLWDVEDVVVAHGIFGFFGIADKLWNGVMDNVAKEINSKGGRAEKTHNFSRKIDWKTDVKKDDKEK